ncbi:MAG: hypothetical protein IKJ88_07750 [Clostridia bacterium]|nr:hypothetical protein [Clostridia bacterium]
MFIETAIGSSLECVLQKELKPYERLLKQASVNLAEIRMHETDATTVDPSFDYLSGERAVLGYNPFDAALAFERRPEKMAFDICSRLIKGGFNYQNWSACDIEGKKEMLKNALEIMSQEMLVPYQYGDIELKFENLEDCSGFAAHSLIFTETDSYHIAETPTITLDIDKITNENFVKNMETLFHEMLHVMQYAATLEPVPYTDDVVFWRDNIVREELYDGEGYTPYITSPIEAYAHAQTELFRKTYLGMLNDINKGYFGGY